MSGEEEENAAELKIGDGNFSFLVFSTNSTLNYCIDLLLYLRSVLLELRSVSLLVIF